MKRRDGVAIDRMPGMNFDYWWTAGVYCVFGLLICNMLFWLVYALFQRRLDKEFDRGFRAGQADSARTALTSLGFFAV